MEPGERQLERLGEALRRRYGDKLDGYTLPPNSFATLQGEILEFNEEAGTLAARFPILEGQLNPYGAMQGGFVAAAVDDTVGPLSLLVAPPNVTRRMEVTYNRPARQEMGYIVVRAWVIEREERRIEFRAEVLDPQGKRLARAKSTQWVMET